MTKIQIAIDSPPNVDHLLDVKRRIKSGKGIGIHPAVGQKEFRHGRQTALCLIDVVVPINSGSTSRAMSGMSE